jgi:4-hydroxy-tetrahydrodipicolinate synthase
MLAVDAFKDSSGDVEALSALSQDVRERVYVGSAALTYEAARLGCRGVILAAANVAPEAAVRVLDGDATALERLMQGDRDLKADFPVSLKRLIRARVDFPLGTRAR